MSIKVELKNLSVGYKKNVILENCNAQVSNRQLIGLIGENGSGKSTLMMTLLKILQPIQGEIFINEHSIQDFSRKDWAKYFSAVLSSRFAVPHIKVKELIALGDLLNSNLTNKNREIKLDEIIEQVGIGDLKEKFANELSDGQLQKVMIARALMQNTPFILFDEPTSHLDYKNKFLIFELLKNIVNQTDKGLIVASHDIEIISEIGDEIWLTKNGKLIIGNPSEIDFIEEFKILKK